MSVPKVTQYLSWRIWVFKVSNISLPVPDHHLAVPVASPEVELFKLTMQNAGAEPCKEAFYDSTWDSEWSAAFPN